MKESKRIFYLDFIRTIAVLTILLTHYNAIFVYLWDDAALKKVVLTWRVANIYIGDFGVSLFLIISGAALMTVYEKGLDIKVYFKKRFLSIYPMFWLAYFCAFMHTFYVSRGIDQTIPKQNIILSILGIDGYLNEIVPTFYKVGEWFLGLIIIVYILFPLLRYCICKYPKITVLFVLGLFCITNYRYNLPMVKSTFVLIRLPEIVLGMLFAKYFKPQKKMACLGIIVLFCNSLLRPNIDKDVQTLYIGIAAFFLLAYIGKYLEDKKLISSIVATVSKYSYSVFLTHHYIIGIVTSKFDLYNISVLESYLLFALCVIWIAIFSKLLYEVNSYVVKRIGNLKAGTF